ncbi:ABC transporter substrate-binding protein [Teichococcus aestuarii]|uniref:ABC transporter substrate-binding protein n=1 Tax=Teichococcus aestuarii TaxID=568898 RepID=UPI0036236786
MSLLLTRRGVLTGAGTLLAARPLRAATPRRIVIAMPNSPGTATLEPSRDYGNVSFRMGYNLYDTLIGIDYRDGAKLVPGLATRWERLSATEMAFTLREGVLFHDGSPMTAEDVAFTFGPERMSDPKAPGYLQTRPFLPTIAGVEAIGPMAVRVTTTGPDPLLERRLAGWGSQVISKRAFLAAPSFSAWEQAPVGTGPFKVKEFSYDRRFVFTAHDAYWGGRPVVDELEFRVVPELASRLNQLATGEADFITEVSPDQIPTIQSMAGRAVAGGAIQNVRAIVYNKFEPALADARVRRALSMAIDRQAIVDSLYGGRTWVPNGHQDRSYGDLYLADYEGPGFQPDRARALLKEAGYGGRRIAYRVLNNYYTLQVQTAQILKEMWGAVGLNVEIEVKENWSQVYQPGLGICDASDTIFWQDPVGAMVRRYGPGSNVQRVIKAWTNEEFNALCPVLQSSLDTAERRRAFRRMLEIYDEVDPPGTALHDLTMFYGKKATIAWQAYPVESMDFRATNMI